MKKLYGVGILLLGAFLLVGVIAVQRHNQKLERYETTFFDVFDTVTVVTGYAGNRETFEEQAKKLQEKLREYHELFDIYHTYEGIISHWTITNRC